MLERLWRYLTGIAQFDLGMSPRHNAPVAQLILDRLGNTLLLMGTALGIAVCAGVLLGVLMSARAGKWQTGCCPSSPCCCIPRPRSGWD